MDSKVVNREIKKAIWPVLKAQGFGHFTSRVAWRHGKDGIDVLEFQSFNSYNAGVLGVTSFSFSVNLGKFLLYVPPPLAPRLKDGVQYPSVPECVFRGALVPEVGAAASSKSVWSVDAAGKNLLWCIRDVQAQLPQAFHWFSRLEDRAEVLRILLNDDENMPQLWGFGRNPSPNRSYYSGYVALALGDTATATERLQDAVESKRFVNLFSSVHGALGRAV